MDEPQIVAWAKILAQYGGAALSGCLIIAVITLWKYIVKLQEKIVELNNKAVEASRKNVDNAYEGMRALERNSAVLSRISDAQENRTALLRELTDDIKSRLDLSVRLSENALDQGRNYVSEYQIYRQFVSQKIEEIIRTQNLTREEIANLRANHQAAISELRIELRDGEVPRRRR